MGTSKRVNAPFLTSAALGLVVILCLKQEMAGITMISMAIRGQEFHCSFWQALNSYAGVVDRIRLADKYISEAKLLDRDGGLELWEIDRERWRLPAGNLRSVSAELAEQKQGIHDSSAISLRTNGIVLDIGAMICVYTRHVLAQGARLVVAVESNPLNLECLKRNLPTEIADRKVRIYPKGLWDRDNLLEMHFLPNDTAAGSFVSGAYGKDLIEIPVTTLDAMVSELGITKVGFIRMTI
jgi:FkbM family methyltransferase